MSAVARAPNPVGCWLSRFVRVEQLCHPDGGGCGGGHLWHEGAVYGEHYAVVTEVIKRLNARRRSKASRFDDDDVEDEEVIEEPEPSTNA